MDYHQPNFYKLNDDSTFLISKLHKLDKNWQNLSILDICSGCGFLGIEAANFFKQSESVTFVEIQEQFIPFIENNLQLLEHGPRINILNQSFEDSIDEDFDLIVCNPPYFEVDESRVSPDINKAISRHFIHGNLSSLVSQIVSKLKDKDSLAFILIRKDHKEGTSIKNRYETKIINIYEKNNVELIVIQNK